MRTWFAIVKTRLCSHQVYGDVVVVFDLVLHQIFNNDVVLRK